MRSFPFGTAALRIFALALLSLTWLALSQAAETSAKTGLPAAKPEKVGFTPERLQRINETVQRHIAAKRISGAVALVARKGRVVYFEATGLMDIKSKKSMRKDALFVLASMTKPVTGVAVMMLMEEGKIHLTDPVSTFIPALKGMKVAVQREGGSQVLLVPA